MPDLLGKSSDWLERQRHKHLTRPVIYKRGSHELELQATIGRTEYPAEDTHGAIVTFEVRDYLVRSEDIAKLLTGKPEPEVGDRIIDAAQVYIVVSIPGAKHWRFSDENRLTMRVHTKLVASDPHHEPGV